ncbi:MAG: hypothetical protein WAX89_00690 [Alphaproteobacteria bacterium]
MTLSQPQLALQDVLNRFLPTIQSFDWFMCAGHIPQSLYPEPHTLRAWQNGRKMPPDDTCDALTILLEALLLEETALRQDLKRYAGIAGDASGPHVQAQLKRLGQKADALMLENTPFKPYLRSHFQPDQWARLKAALAELNKTSP